MDSTADPVTTTSLTETPAAASGPASLGLDLQSAVGLAESAEAEFMWALHEGAPDDVKRALGMTSRRIGGGVALVMRHDPTGGYWNKALGFGVTEPVTADLVAEVADFYRVGGAPAMCLQLAPSVLPDDWDETCARHAIEPRSTWVKLLRPADPAPPEGPTDLRIGVVEAASAAAYGQVFAQGFEMPQEPHMLAMFAAAATSGLGFTAYGAWDGDRLVAVAQLHVAGQAAAFCGAATVPDARGRGAQSAFMARRVADARAAGCSWMSAETWQETDGTHNSSLHNMKRAGFVELYDRRNWVWRRDA